MKKPVVAFTTEKLARKNLERKVDYLKKRIEEGAKPPDVPGSLRKFNMWEVVDTQGITFSRNANETLKKHEDLRKSAAALINAAKEAAKPVIRARDTGLKRARDKVQLHLAIRQIAEAALLRSRAENLKLRRDIEALRAQVESIGEEAARLREAHEAEMGTLRARNAELLRSKPSNVRAIRRDK